MINKEVKKRGIPGIIFVDENLVEEMIGSVRVYTNAFCRPMEGHRLGCIKIRAAKGKLQKRGLEIELIGLIAGSKEVNRSGVMLGSTSEELSF